MAENASVKNSITAKGRIVGMGRDDFGHTRFILFVRTDRNGRRSRRVSEEDAVIRSIPVFARAIGNPVKVNVPEHELVLSAENNSPSARLDGTQIPLREAARYVVAASRGEAPAEGTRQDAAQRRRDREEPEGIYASFAYGADVPEDLRIGDYVEVDGHATAYFARNRLWENRYSYIQYLVADRVAPCKTLIEDVFGLKAGFYTGRHFLDMFLRGTVSGVSNSNGWKVLTLVVSGGPGRRDDTLRVQYSASSRLNSIGAEAGDEIAIVASLVTRQKEISGTMRYFENILAEDMTIIRKAASTGDIDADAEDLFSALDDEEFTGEDAVEKGDESEETEEATAGDAESGSDGGSGEDAPDEKTAVSEDASTSDD